MTEATVEDSELQAAAIDAKSTGRRAMLAGAVVPTLMRLALPTITVLVAQTMVGIAETYYVGFLGTDALAGVSVVFPIWMLMVTMSNGGAANASTRACSALKLGS